MEIVTNRSINNFLLQFLFFLKYLTLSLVQLMTPFSYRTSSSFGELKNIVFAPLSNRNCGICELRAHSIPNIPSSPMKGIG